MILEDYVQERQRQSLWCWAAVACSVTAYPAGTNWTQCSIAQAVLSRQGCCAFPSSCNEMDSLRTALQVTSALAEHRPRAVDLDAIRRQINHRHPVGIRVHRPDRTAHVLVIVGYADFGSDALLALRDPLFGPGEVSFETLRFHGYQQGQWSDTYFTT